SILEPKSSASPNSATSASGTSLLPGQGTTRSGSRAPAAHSLNILLQTIESLVDLQAIGINGFDGFFQIGQPIAQTNKTAVTIVQRGTNVGHVLGHALYTLNAALEVENALFGYSH